MSDWLTKKRAEVWIFFESVRTIADSDMLIWLSAGGTQIGITTSQGRRFVFPWEWDRFVAMRCLPDPDKELEFEAAGPPLG